MIRYISLLALLLSGIVGYSQVRFRMDTVVSQAAPGPLSEIRMAFRVDNFTNIRGLSGTLAFDSTVVDYLGITQVSLPSPGNLLVGNPIGRDSRITFSWFSGSGATVANGTAIFQVRFRVLGTLNSQTAFTFTGSPTKLEVINTSLQKLIPVTDPGLLTFSGIRIYGDTLTGAPASQAVALFRVEDYASITSGQGVLRWDPAVLSFVGTEQYGLPSIDSYSFGLTQVANGEASFSYYAATGESLPDGSVLFGIRFDLVGANGDASQITMQDGVLIPSAMVEFSQENSFSIYEANAILDPGRIEVVTPPGIRLSPKVFLQGPYSGSGIMNAVLRFQPTFPLTDPYLGTQTTTSPILSTLGQEVVDWVLVQLRDPVSSSIVVASRPGLLRKDGSIIGADGDVLFFPGTPNGNYRVVIKHRNHLGVMSQNAYALSFTPVSLDFTDGSVATFGFSAQRSFSGVLQLWGGDADGNGLIQTTDNILYWVPTSGQGGYLPADYDLNGVVQTTDRILIWIPNTGRSAQVP